MPEGKPSSAPRAPASPELPTAEASLIISMRPDLGARLDAKVPARHAVTLVTAFSQVAAVALLGVIAPVATVTAAYMAGVPAIWVAVLVLIEIAGAAASAITAVRVHRRRQ